MEKCRTAEKGCKTPVSEEIYNKTDGTEIEVPSVLL
jgi:hypothetical protein